MRGRTGRILYEQRGPFAPGMHGLADDATTQTPGWWQSQWQAAVDRFRNVWNAFANSKTTLETAGYALDSIDPSQVDPSQLADLHNRADALTNEESSIDDVVATAIRYIHGVEDKLGWTETQLGIIGIDDAVVITAVITAGVAAVGYYVYKITTHTENVNQLAAELQAVGKGVLSPSQLLQLQTAQNASEVGGPLKDILSAVMPYVGIALGGYLAWQLVSGAIRKRAGS